MKATIKYLTRGVAFFLLMVIVYFLFAVLLSVIPVNRHQEMNKGVEIYIRSNGVHLEIVLPLKTEVKDWSEEIWINKEITGRARYISFGWGDRNFYIKTPEWSDLTISTAFKALFLRSSSAMHVDYYTELHTGTSCKHIFISNAQYRQIVKFVDAAFQRDKHHNLIRIENLNYSQYDCFYEANGIYHLFFTCNTWTNRCLKKAGLKACFWTPFDKGILFHYRNE